MVARRLFLAATLGVVTTITLSAQIACGSQTPPTVPADGAVTEDLPRITGSEKLAWSQPATSLAEARGFGYVVYVDEIPQRLPDTSCQTGSNPAVFECTTTLPKLDAGRRVLVLVAVDSRGVEGHRALPLVVQVVP